MTKYINPNILDEGNQMELIEDNEDYLLRMVRCNNCGNIIPYGSTRMICGFVGCDSKINIDGKEIKCFFDDLMPRVMRYKENQSPKYKTGKVYRWRDGVDR